jgi:hypothetical protein
MTDHATPTRARRGSQILSTILFVAALAFAAAAVYIWYLDDSNAVDEPPVPSVEAGQYGLVNVLEALKDAGIDADYGRSPATAMTNQMELPGQNLRVGDANVFIFLFPSGDTTTGAEARAAAFDRLDLETLTLTTQSGSDASQGKPLTAYEGANVIAVMVGGNPELQSEVQAVIEGLG